MKMVGRVMLRTRSLWIMIISFIILAAIAAAIWVVSTQQKPEIPQKGVFVIQR